MKFIWDKKFNRYRVQLPNGEYAGYVYGGIGNWRAYAAANGIVREGRTRAIAAERMLLATGQIRRPA
jgi:hypothetical protein